jgi:hypothetical protein
LRDRWSTSIDGVPQHDLDVADRRRQSGRHMGIPGVKIKPRSYIATGGDDIRTQPFG